jgi:hypothetical protein
VRPKLGAAPSVPKSPWIQINEQAHPELRVPDGSFTASGNGGQRLTVIPGIENWS